MVSRGGKIEKLDLDVLASNANAKVAGAPYQFVARRYLISTEEDGPPWRAADRRLLQGIQPGEFVINTRKPRHGSNFYALVYRLDTLPEIGSTQDPLATATWTSMDPGFRVVANTTELNALSGPDGYLVFVLDRFNTVPALMVRRGGAWVDYEQYRLTTIIPAPRTQQASLLRTSNGGWLTELNRLRAAIAARLNGSVSGSVLSRRATVSAPYHVGILTGGGGWSFTVPTPGTYKDVEFWFPDDLIVACHRRIVPPITYRASAGGFDCGFVSSVDPPGKIAGSVAIVGLTVLSGTGANVILGFPSSNLFVVRNALHIALTGPLANKAALEVRVNSAGTFDIVATFNGSELPAGEWWIGVTATVDATITDGARTFTGCHFGTAVATWKFGPGNQNGQDGMRLDKDYESATSPAPVLHIKKRFLRQKFRGENLVIEALPGAPSNFAAGESIAAVSYYAGVSGPEQTVFVVARGTPLGSRDSFGDGTMMDLPGASGGSGTVSGQGRNYFYGFGPHAMDRATSAEMRRSIDVAIEPRGPFLFPNVRAADGTLTSDNVPRAALCKTYPAVPFAEGMGLTPIVSDQNAVSGGYGGSGGYGQILRIVAVRRGEENEDGVVIQDPDDDVHIEVGCLRAGDFARLAQVTIASGERSGVWEPEAGEPGILVAQFYPLVVRGEGALVFAQWFHASRNVAIGVAPPVMADHYNETEEMLGLV